METGSPASLIEDDHAMTAGAAASSSTVSSASLSSSSASSSAASSLASGGTCAICARAFGASRLTANAPRLAFASASSSGRIDLPSLCKFDKTASKSSEVYLTSRSRTLNGHPQNLSEVTPNRAKRRSSSPEMIGLRSGREADLRAQPGRPI